jgi:hypothetical protein
MPDEAPLLRWLRVNVAVGMAGIGLLGTVLGTAGTMLVQGTTMYRQVMDDHAALEQRGRDMVSVDGRFNDLARDRQARAEAFRRDMADLERRASVLEAQMQFLSTRLPTPPLVKR